MAPMAKFRHVSHFQLELPRKRFSTATPDPDGGNLHKAQSHQAQPLG